MGVSGSGCKTGVTFGDQFAQQVRKGIINQPVDLHVACVDQTKNNRVEKLKSGSHILNATGLHRANSAIYSRMF